MLDYQNRIMTLLNLTNGRFTELLIKRTRNSEQENATPDDKSKEELGQQVMHLRREGKQKRNCRIIKYN